MGAHGAVGGGAAADGAAVASASTTVPPTAAGGGCTSYAGKGAKPVGAAPPPAADGAAEGASMTLYAVLTPTPACSTAAAANASLVAHGSLPGGAATRWALPGCGGAA